MFQSPKLLARHGLLVQAAVQPTYDPAGLEWDTEVIPRGSVLRLGLVAVRGALASLIARYQAATHNHSRPFLLRRAAISKAARRFTQVDVLLGRGCSFDCGSGYGDG
jgi:hypothetical protein